MRQPIWWRTLFWLLTQHYQWDICHMELGNCKFFGITKFEALASKKLVNHTCLGENECCYPYEENSEKHFNIRYHLTFISFSSKKRFLKTGGRHTWDLRNPPQAELIRSSHKSKLWMPIPLIIFTHIFTTIKVIL